MTIYINVTNTALTMTKTGIQRVVRELSARLWDRENIKIICWWKTGFRTLESTQDQSSFLTGKIIQPKIDARLESMCKGDIFVDIDASWGDEYSTKELFQRLKQVGVIIVKMHYDAVPILFPQFSHENTVFSYSENFGNALQYADYWWCISKTVERDLLKIAKRINAGTPTTQVIELGADFNISNSPPPPQKQRTRPYLLAVGTLEPRKNYPLLIQAIDLIIANNLAVDLVIVGKQGWKTEQLQKHIEKHKHFKKRIHWLKNVSDEEITELYQQAFACINTSHYEGYGLPVIESLSHNCVTICSQNSAMEEVSKGSSYTIQPTAEAILKAVIELQKPDIYAHYQLLANNFCTPSWNNSADKLYRQLVNIHNIKNFNTEPYQAVYISVRPKSLAKSLESISEHMGFITQVIVLTPSQYLDAMAQATQHIKLNITFIEEASIGLSELPDDHLIRNSLLRKTLYSQALIAENFIAFDDDYRVTAECTISDFIENGKHKAHYFYYDAKDWMGAFPTPTSFDQGLWRTARLLESSGYDTKLYNAHMPQIINKEIVQKILTRSSDLGVDEWSVYFNIAKHLHPKYFLDCVYRTSGWPANFDSWLPSVAPENIIFENHDHESISSSSPQDYLTGLQAAKIFNKKTTPSNPEITFQGGKLEFSGEKICAPSKANLFLKLNIFSNNFTLRCCFAGRQELYDQDDLPRFLFIPTNAFKHLPRDNSIEIQVSTQGHTTSLKIQLHISD